MIKILCCSRTNRNRISGCMNFFYIYVGNKSQSHLQCGSQSSYNTFHFVFHHVTNKHVFNMIPVVIVKKNTKQYMSINIGLIKNANILTLDSKIGYVPNKFSFCVQLSNIYYIITLRKKTIHQIFVKCRELIYI